MSGHYAKDGRRIMEPPCSLGHTRQSTECPSCSEVVTGNKSSDEWWAWHRKRYPKTHARARATSTTGECEALTTE